MAITRILVLVGVLLAAMVGTSGAQNKKAAAIADEQARAYFKVEAYEDAAKEFEKGYRLERKATRLYNAGLSYEKANQPKKASELYARFLAEQSSGSKATEARARKKALDKRILEQGKATQAAEAKRLQAQAIQALAKTANERLSAGDYPGAAAMFESAYQASQDPEYLFDKAEALRLAGENTAALAAYRLYRRHAPTGVNTGAALRYQEQLETSAMTTVPTSKPDGGTAEPLATDSSEPIDLSNTSEESSPGRKKAKPGGLSWGWLGVGVGVLAAGVAADLIPSSGDNGTFDGTDLLPVALYGASGFFLYKGVF